MKFMALPGIIGVGILYLIPGCALFYYALINNVFQKKKACGHVFAEGSVF